MGWEISCLLKKYFIYNFILFVFFQIPSNEDREVSISTDFSALTLYNQGLKAVERGEVTYRKSRFLSVFYLNYNLPFQSGILRL